ncbi:hypothetical protein GmHk_11G032722 [Glycine max]|nr:hypothetical protein GmHk_11G032722 [Glycine max]
MESSQGLDAQERNKLLSRQIEALTETLNKLPWQLQTDHNWRYYPSNNCNQGGLPYQHPSQGPSQEEKPTNIEELLIQFMQETRSHMKRTDATIKNLEVQIGQLAELVAEKPTETFAVNAEMKPKEDCKVIFTEREEKEKKTEEDVRDEEGEKKEERERNEEKAQQWEKYSQVEIQQENILQVNTPPHQLIVKEERHGEHEKALSVILSLIATTSLAIMWKVLPEYTSFMATLAKRRKCKEDVFNVTFMPP